MARAPADARAAALAVLLAVRDGTPFDAALDRAVGALGTDDRRLAHALAAGVLRRQAALDTMLAPHATRGWSKVPPELQAILRLGAFQLTDMDRIPAHAAVHATVELARARVGAHASGFVNAVLRRVSERVPAPLPPPDPDVPAPYLQGLESHPEWLVLRWLERFGRAGTEALLAWNDTPPSLVIQPARAPRARLTAALAGAGIGFHPAPFGAGLVVDASRPTLLPGFAEGDFLVQDPAQALVLWYADPDPAGVVYDACAAPGGKTLGLGAGARVVVAGDARASRMDRLRANLARAGRGNEHAVVADARHPPLRSADVVFLDAPCLGTGTFARHPDARHRVSAEALALLVATQAALLEAVAPVVRPGGLLVYSTCSLEPEENGEQVDAFLARHPDFHRDPNRELPPVLLSARGDLEILPQRHHTDGAFAARLRRRA